MNATARGAEGGPRAVAFRYEDASDAGGATSFTLVLASQSACGQAGVNGYPERPAPPHSTTAVSCVFAPSLTIFTSSSPLLLLYFSKPSPIPMVLATITADNQNGAPSPN